MKERTPHCPHCKTAAYVVLDRTGTRIGTAVGGLLGMGCAKVIVPPAKALFKAAFPQACLHFHLADTLMTLLLAFAGGATTGAGVGGHIDGNLRMRYRCNACGHLIRG